MTPGQPTPQPTDAPNLRDIGPSQHRQLDEQIADLQASPQILAECAAEAGDPVPAPGSEGEAEWYGQAAIRYSPCAASKATGVDLTGRNYAMPMRLLSYVLLLAGFTAAHVTFAERPDSCAPEDREISGNINSGYRLLLGY